MESFDQSAREKGAAQSRRSGAFAAALLAFSIWLGAPGAVFAQLVVDPGTVVQTIDTSLWSPPSPDPSGITYLPETGQLLTCDAEVDEMSIWAGANLWFHGNDGTVHETESTLPWSNEPAGIAIDPAGGRLWVADDNAGRIYQVEFGTDGEFGTADDVISDLEGLFAAGCEDIEDVTLNTLDGHLYVASSQSDEICEIEPGPNGVFDGAAPSGDDLVTTVNVGLIGIVDPEGIVYDPLWDTLVVADRKSRDLYEITPDGTLLRKIDVDFPDGSKPSGVTIAPGSTNPALRNYWVTDRRTDNLTNPLENDGKLYEVVAVPLGGNGAPSVDAGAPQTLEWPANSVSLHGFVSDDGHPYPPSTLLSQWSQLEGPGAVTFGDASAPETTATFSTPGAYVLQLLGDDSAEQTTDTVAITVNDTVALGVSITGSGSVTLNPSGGSYPAGTLVTLTAVPSSGQVFDGWSGDLTGSTSPAQLAVNTDKQVTARFKASGGGGGSFACGIGPELIAALPLLAWLRRRSRRA